jgi:lipopolysaccharide biosynthesis protein
MQIINTLDNKNSSLVGPEGEYVSLLVNFTATSHYLKSVTGKVLHTQTADEMIRSADEYGFFAGTMFWARLDVLLPILNNINIEDFEPELGQVDSTLAHALERLMSLIPVLQGKEIFEARSDGVVKIDPHTTNIPEWSEVALEDKN